VRGEGVYGGIGTAARPGTGAKAARAQAEAERGGQGSVEIVLKEEKRISKSVNVPEIPEILVGQVCERGLIGS
jgi:hypothetical protein